MRRLASESRLDAGLDARDGLRDPRSTCSMTASATSHPRREALHADKALDADTFMERLCSMVPRPNTNTILYTGVLAPNSKLREHVVPEQQGDLPPRRENGT